MAASIATPAESPAPAPSPEPPKATAETPPASPTKSSTEIAPIRVRAHALLVKSCGSCHQSTLATAKPEALAAFDLDQDDWYRSFNKEKLESAKKRIDGSGSEADKLTFDEFMNAEFGG